MESLTLHEAKIRAQMLCTRTRSTVDIYKSGDGYKFALSGLRKSNTTEYRVTHEKGKTITRNSQGRKTDEVDHRPKKKGTRSYQSLNSDTDETKE